MEDNKDKKAQKKTKKLNNEKEIPLMGLGTSRIENPAEIVYSSIVNGVRLIDTAVKYGNEKEVGEGITKAIKEGICKREDLIIMGKVWINQRNDPEKALRESLKKLKLDYIDIYMDHWPSGKDYNENSFKMVPVYEFWPKMEELVDKKLAKSIGVSNYNIQCLSNLLNICRIKPVVNQVEYHLFYIQKTLKEFCDKQDIAIISYYPMPHGNGVRMLLLDKNNSEFDIFQDSLIKELSIKYKKTEGQIILNWHYKSGVIPIPSTSRKERMKENLEALEFEMENEDFEKLSNHFKQISFKKFCGCRRFFGVNVLA